MQNQKGVFLHYYKTLERQNLLDWKLNLLNSRYWYICGISNQILFYISLKFYILNTSCQFFSFYAKLPFFSKVGLYINKIWKYPTTNKKFQICRKGHILYKYMCKHQMTSAYIFPWKVFTQCFSLKQLLSRLSMQVAISVCLSGFPPPPARCQKKTITQPNYTPLTLCHYSNEIYIQLTSQLFDFLFF